MRDCAKAKKAHVMTEITAALFAFKNTIHKFSYRRTFKKRLHTIPIYPTHDQTSNKRRESEIETTAAFQRHDERVVVVSAECALKSS
jgi:hypothetical protein